MSITLEQLKSYCRRERVAVQVDDLGLLWSSGDEAPMFGQLEESQLVDSIQSHENMRAASQDAARLSGLEQLTATVELKRREGAIFLQADGYEHLALVLQRAFIQASHGKGKERHAQHGEPFTSQVIFDGARRFGVGALLFQAYKKAEESQRLPADRGVAELLGAIVYLAAAVIERERRELSTSAPKADNDNAPCCNGGTQTARRCMNCAEFQRHA
jgi:hypothetical protein